MLDRIKLLCFPLAMAMNLFSISGLIIVAGAFGYGELAADIAVIQGALLVVFMSLSGNVRNLIISRQLEHGLTESPRVLRRFQHQREWSHEQDKQVFP